VSGERRTMLDPQFGRLYPEIPAGYWMSAWQAATRRAERVWREAGAEALISGRLLPDEHFYFRGGRRRNPGWPVVPERLSDPGAGSGTDQYP
jgi:cytochrome P450